MAEAFSAFMDSKGESGMDTLLALLSELLSQDDNKWSLEDLKELMDKSQDTDPGFWLWFQNRVMQAIKDHRLQRKKV